jgi:metal-responsive CopG/Arc/MetJ family transcriptional regulator
MAAVDCLFQEDKMSESELVRDLVQEGIRQAMQLEALKNIRFLIITPVVLALILWRVW